MGQWICGVQGMLDARLQTRHPFPHLGEGGDLVRTGIGISREERGMFKTCEMAS